MTDYREILRLTSLGLNRTQIADSVGVSRTTAINTLQRTSALELDWQAAEPLSDKELAAKLFPQGDGKLSYKMPDYDYIHKEMSKPGVTQQLLWYEYSAIGITDSDVIRDTICDTDSSHNGHTDSGIMNVGNADSSADAGRGRS